jgi:uncharacterized protein
MALRGSLTDLNIVELVQVPAASRKTGELFIAGLDGIARLFYAAGRLVHVEVDEVSGQDAMVEVVGWSEGEFEFRPDVEPERRTFEMDLHKALMLALKQRDELKLAESSPPVDHTQLGELLRAFLASTDFIQFCCVLNSDGSTVRCDSRQAGDPSWLAGLRSVVGLLLEGYPRKGLQRVLLEDADGTVVVSRLADGSALVVVAERDARLGAVSVAVERFLRRLGEAAGDVQR